MDPLSLGSVTDLNWNDFEAVLFDLDGVLTPTAKVHAAAWKATFDDFLATRPGQSPFDIDRDYRRYVDGRPRYDGVATFLASRGIELPTGSPDDPPGAETVCGVGNRKNDMVTTLLETQGVEAFPGSIALLDHVTGLGLKRAVVSASANATHVLAAAGLSDRFGAVVDGIVAADLGLAGKPAPDPFLEAARRLDVAPAKAVVVEDAVSGVKAGVAGGFGAVVGVDRHHDPAALQAAGATVVVADLGELVP